MRKLCIAVVILLVVSAVICGAAEVVAKPTGNVFKTKTKSVAIFKDGYGFFLREGKASLQDGWCMTDYIPKATAGTFWLYTMEPGTAINTVRSTGNNGIKFEGAADLGNILGRYPGVQVSLRTDDGVTEGELLQIVNDMVLLKSGKQISMVKLGDVKTARILDNPLLLEVTGAKAKDVTVQMGYLQQGINWIPNYTLDLTSGSEAKMTLRATITNSVEDLSGCKLFFVVGVPNFMMKGQLDALTVNALGTAVVRNLPGAPPQSQTANSFYQNDMSRAARDVDNDIIVREEQNLSVEGVQDLYFYEKDGLDVAAGDVVMTTIKTAALPYHSVFTWNADGDNRVDHFLVIKNTTGDPLTTGPVMVVQNGQPLGQDQMKYISPKAEGRLKVTQSTDIRTDKTEREKERGQGEKMDGNTYIPVTMQGELTIENYRPETVEMEVSWSVNGKTSEASDNAKIVADSSPDRGLNPKTSLNATVKVEAGKKKIITYSYVRYVLARA